MEERKIQYWMAKDNWSTLVLYIPVEQIGEFLTRIHDCIQESGLVESFHFRVGDYPKSDKARIPLCYRMLRKAGNSNNQLESTIGDLICKLLGNTGRYAFNPKEGDLLKNYEQWPNPCDSAKEYQMSPAEWVTFMVLLNKFSDFATSLAKEDFLSLQYRWNVAHLFHNILFMNVVRKSITDYLTGCVFV
jgi:hypothetical protein